MYDAIVSLSFLRVMGKLGKLPGISKKPLPNSSMMTEEQLKQELRVRAQEVEEAVLALRGACGSMNPQDMRGVLEKRLHMELVMAANLAEQQEAVSCYLLGCLSAFWSWFSSGCLNAAS